MSNKIRVGIIGVSPERGWATMAHIPALKSLPEFEITAISHRDAETAAKAGEKFDIKNVYTTTAALVGSDAVDMVVITVKVPQHKKLVAAAVEAGKNVFCEWPLGNGLAETEELVALAEHKGVKAFIGLQSRMVPAVNYVKDLLAQGYAGEVLSTSMIGSGILYGAFVDRASAWALNAGNGGGMINTTFANSADALCYTLGEFTSLNATTVNKRSDAKVTETGETVPMNVMDQVAVSGVLENGAVASIHFRGGLSKGTNFIWEINGTKGDLVITADGGHLGVYPPVIRGANETHSKLQTLQVPPEYYTIPSNTLAGPPHAVAENYKRLAKDLAMGTSTSPNFKHALVRHRMISAIEAAAFTGTRQCYQYLL